LEQSFHLLGLIAKEELEGFLEAFTAATGVAAIISGPDGSPITEPFNFSSLCRNFCRATESGRLKCVASDKYGGELSTRSRKRVIYRCLNAGLLDSAAPIIVEGYHLANVLCGQVLDMPIDESEAARRARAIGIKDTEAYLEELSKIPIISPDRFSAIVNLMGVVTQTVSELAFQKYLLYKQSRRYMEKLVNSVSDCILAINREGMIRMANEACSRVFDMPKARLIGHPILKLFSDDESARIFQERMSLSTSDGGRADVLIKGQVNAKIPMQISLSRIESEDGETAGYVTVMRDVTEEKKTAQMKEDLFGMLTHDMGNPILSMQKAMELLVDETLGPLNNDQKELAGLALETSHQLYGMAADFLDIYRHENNRFMLRKLPVDITEILLESLNQIQLFSQDKNIDITFPQKGERFRISADCNRIKRVCINLLENALKFSPEKTEIEVRVEQFDGCAPKKMFKVMPAHLHAALDAEKSYLMISVSDEGLGIEAEDQPHIFKKFFVAKSRNEKGRKGLGLGLAYCRLAIEAHGGYIWVKSPVYENKVFKQRGCRFSFVLPMEDDPQDPLTTVHQPHIAEEEFN